MKSLRFAPVWLALALTLAVPSLASGSSPATGSSWTVAASPNPGGWGNIVWAMSALTERDVWAVGVQATYTSNDPLALHWNGTSWTAVATPTPVPNCEDGNIQWTGNSLNGADGATSNDVWAVGGTCYGIDTLLEHWNGSAWSIVPGPQPPGGAWGTLYGVEAISRSNVWAVGYYSPGGIEPLVEHFNGQNWTIVPTARVGAPAGGSAICPPWLRPARTTSGRWAVRIAGRWSSTSTALSGASFQRLGPPAPGWTRSRRSRRRTSGRSGRSGSAPISRSSCTTTARAGRSSRAPNPSAAYNADNELRDVAAVGPSDIWAVGMYENEQTNIHQHRTLIEHWNGTSWSIVSSPSPGHSSELNAAAIARGFSPLSRPRAFAAGLFSNYDINIYDGTYTLPQTLVMDTR